MLLLVDQTMAAPLANELQRLRQDLVGDGWRVLRHDVPRHNDAVWSANTNSIHAIKQLVVSNYAVHGSALKTLYLLGHVAVPYTGFTAEDGHSGCSGLPALGNHMGAWSSDLYHADLDGIWKDTHAVTVSCTNWIPYTFPITSNAPADGKLDGDLVPANPADSNRMPELGVGRLDFANLPAFSSPPPPLLPAQETDLLRRYLDKNRRFRRGLTLFQRQVAYSTHVVPNDPGALDAGLAAATRVPLNGVSAPPGLGTGSIFLANRLATFFGLLDTYGCWDRLACGNPVHEHPITRLTDPGNQPRPDRSPILVRACSLKHPDAMKTLIAFCLTACASPFVRSVEFKNFNFELFDPTGLTWPDPPIIGEFSAGGPADRLAPGWSFFNREIQTGTCSRLTWLRTDFPPVIGGQSYLSIFHISASIFPLLEGRYALNAAPRDMGLSGSIELIVSQSGHVPADAQSIRFLATWDPWTVYVDGIQIPLIGYDTPLGRGEVREILGDISAFAGQEVELKFVTRSVSFGYNGLDSIRFSPEAVPEPGSAGLLALGGLAWLAGPYAARRRRTA